MRTVSRNGPAFRKRQLAGLSSYYYVLPPEPQPDRRRGGCKREVVSVKDPPSPVGHLVEFAAPRAVPVGKVRMPCPTAASKAAASATRAKVATSSAGRRLSHHLAAGATMVIAAFYVHIFRFGMVLARTRQLVAGVLHASTSAEERPPRVAQLPGVRLPCRHELGLLDALRRL